MCYRMLECIKINRKWVKQNNNNKIFLKSLVFNLITTNKIKSKNSPRYFLILEKNILKVSTEIPPKLSWRPVHYRNHHYQQICVIFLFFIFFFQNVQTRSNTPPWVFFPFFKLYKWYQIAQCITCIFPGTCCSLCLV